MASGQPYEYRLLRVLARLVRRGSIVIDIGAHIGNHTIFLALTRDALVHAFEPNPAAMSYLRWNVNHNGLDRQVILHPEALGDEATPMTIRLPSHQLGVARAVPDPSGEIPGIRLDDLTFAHGDVSLVKIDVEGGEGAVLRGATETLREHRPWIAVEAQTREAERAVDEILGGLGYHRFPVSLAYTPTFVCMPRRRPPVALLAAMRSKDVRAAGRRVTVRQDG
jgi:FkbM family methyltransferase